MKQYVVAFLILSVVLSGCAAGSNADGASASNPVCCNNTSGSSGKTGAMGAQGSTGPEGPQGPAGMTGAMGATGPQGPEGPAGPQGIPGAQGAQGEPGATGMSGMTGAQGPQGIQGATGPQGPAGPAGTFSKASVYTVESAVATCIGGSPCVADAYCKNAADVLLHGVCHITPSSMSPAAAVGTPNDMPAGTASYFDCTIGAGFTVTGEGLFATVTCITGQ